MAAFDTLALLAGRALGSHLRGLQALVDELNGRAAEGDAEAVAATLGQLQSLLQGWASDVATSQTDALELSARVAAADLYGEGWWQRLSEDLRAQFSGEPDLAIRAWTSAYLDALLAGELEFCRRLTELEVAFPAGVRELISSLGGAASALADNQLDVAARSYGLLLRAAWPGLTLLVDDPAHRAALTVLTGRIHLAVGREAGARRRFEAAIELAPNDPLPRCGMGDYWTARGKRRRAESYYREALEAQALGSADGDGFARPDPYLGLGRLAEQRASWDDAERWYSEAIALVAPRRHPQRAFEAMLAPVSGAALWRLSEALIDGDPTDALTAARAALAFDFEWGGVPGRPLAELIEARALKTVEDPTAATVYARAGRGLAESRRSSDAVAALEEAINVDPADASLRWDLADVLRIAVAVAVAVSELDEPQEQQLSDAQRIWWEGTNLREPRDNEAWAYAVMAFIVMQLAALPEADRWRLTWEEVEWLERAIRLQPGYAAALVELADAFRRLQLPACALATSDSVLATGLNVDALLQRAIALANLGRFDEARTAIGELRANGTGSEEMCEFLLAFIAAQSGAASEALPYLDRVIEAGKDDLSDRSLRAYARRQLDDIPGAIEDYQYILDHPEKETPNDTGWIAYAAYFVGDLDRARPAAARLLEDRMREPTWRMLVAGLVSLTCGELNEGRKLCLQALVDAPTLPDFQRYVEELEELARRAEVRSDGEPLRATARTLLHDAPAHAEAARNRSHRTPMDELVGAAGDASADESFARRGARASIARFLVEGGQLRAAADVHQELDDHLVPADLPRMADVSLDVARHRLSAGEPTGAHTIAAETERCLEERHGEEPERLARARALMLLSELNQQRPDVAEGRLSELLDDSSGTSAPLLGAEIRKSLATAGEFWLVDAALTSVATNLPRRAEQCAGVRRELDGYLEADLGLGETPVQEQPRQETVEIGWGLVAEDTGPNWVLFTKYIPEMRRRISDQLGVDVPGVLFRGGEGLAPGGYRIYLDEIKEAEGVVPIDLVYVPGHDCDDAPNTTARPERHPLTQAIGYWMPASELSNIARDENDVWRDPLLFVVARLEAVLLRHIDEHLSLENVDDLLETWSIIPANAILINRLLPDEDARLELARVLRALLRERVPVLDGAAILSTLASTGLGASPREAVLRALRLELREQLPGNEPGAHFVLLPDDVAAELSNDGRRDGGDGAARPAASELRAVGAIRGALESTAGPAVLVVRDSQLRLPVRLLIEAEFPDVPVISTEELTVPVEEVMSVPLSPKA
jgi:tetratricopeptide (TPR) repeat protein